MNTSFMLNTPTTIKANHSVRKNEAIFKTTTPDGFDWYETEAEYREGANAWSDRNAEFAAYCLATAETLKAITAKRSARRERAKAASRAFREEMRGIGMTRVRGNLGGIYWE